MYPNKIHRLLYDDPTSVKMTPTVSGLLKAADAVMSVEEFHELFTVAQRIRRSETLSDFLSVFDGMSEKTFAKHYNVSPEDLARYKREGIDETAKRLLSFAMLSDYLYEIKTSTCVGCRRVYIVTDPDVHFCAECTKLFSSAEKHTKDEDDMDIWDV